MALIDKFTNDFVLNYRLESLNIHKKKTFNIKH
jgi:hypothetical protein